MRVLFIDGTRGFTPTRLLEKPTGGIITSLTLVPQFLAKHGLDVQVHSLWEGEAVLGGVKYSREVSGHYDVVVFNRNCVDRAVISYFKDSRKVWWLHDIVDPSYCLDDGFRSVDDVVALSAYNKRSYADYYGISPDFFTIIPNGVDKSVFYPGTEPRDRNLYVYASAPIKGMYPLEFTLHNLKRLSPAFELRVYSDQGLHDLENTAAMNAALSTLRKAGASVLPPIPQRDLADVFRKAWAFLMPGHYPENHSNLAEQAKACGLPIIASPVGSLTEQVTHEVNGLLTKTMPHDMFWWHKEYAQLCAELHLDGFRQGQLSSRAPNGVLSWDQVGAMWFEFLMGEMPETKGEAQKCLTHS